MATEEKMELLIDDPNYSDPSDDARQVADIESNYDYDSSGDDEEKEAHININNNLQQNQVEFETDYTCIICDTLAFYFMSNFQCLLPRDHIEIIIANNNYVDNFKLALQNPWILVCGCCSYWLFAHILLIWAI